MTALRLCFLIFCAGGCGALARFGMTQAVGRFITSSYPLGTLVVNVLGSFLFGFVWELAAVRMMIADATRVVLCVGFMGSFTTFPHSFSTVLCWRRRVRSCSSSISSSRLFWVSQLSMAASRRPV